MYLKSSRSEFQVVGDGRLPAWRIGGYVEDVPVTLLVSSEAAGK